MDNQTEGVDLDKLQRSTYENGPCNVPRLPDRVVDILIDSAGVSRYAPGRTDITVRDQTANVEQLVHDTCEELLARLPDLARRAEPSVAAGDERVLPKQLPEDVLRYAMECAGLNNPDGARTIKAVWTFIRDGLLHPVSPGTEVRHIEATTASASEQTVVNDAFLTGAHAEFSEAMPPGSLTSLGHRHVVNALRAAIKFYIQVDAYRIDTPIRLLREVLKQHDDHAELIRAEGNYPVPNPTAERIRAVLANSGASHAANAGEAGLDEAAAYRLWRDCEIMEDTWFMEHIASKLPVDCMHRAPTVAEWDAAMAAVMRDRAAIASSTAQEGK